MITARGVGFLIAAVALFFISSATSVGWVRIVDAVLWGMLGLSLLLQWFTVVSLSARRRLQSPAQTGDSPSPMEDDEVDIELQLRNRRFYPRNFLAVTFDCPFADPQSRQQRLLVANLRGDSEIRLTSRIQCYRRGMHRMKSVIIESRVPFGLFRRRRRLDAPLSVLVYPRALPLHRLALLEGSLGTVPRAHISRVGQDVVGSRPYHPGDPLRHIHWRNTARLGELAVKELEEATEKSVTITFDVQHDIGDGRETTLEYSIKLAASVGLFAQRAGEAVRVVAGVLDGQWTAATPFLTELALLEAGDSPPLGELVQRISPTSKAILIVRAADLDGARALANSAPRLPSLAAVVLEGFGEGERPDAATTSLRSAGIPTVVCRPGGLEEALASLGEPGTHYASAKSYASP